MTLPPHRDMPPGSQRWAEYVDRLEGRVEYLESLVRRLAENAGVDPSNPDGRVNAQDGVPSATSAVVQKITSLDDVNAYNVADGQVLTWSQADQAFTPVTPAGGGDFAPDPSVTQYTWEPSGYTMAHGTGALETSATTGSYAWYGWTSDGQLDVESRSAGYKMGMFTVNANGVLTLYATSPDTPSVRTRVEVNATGNAVDVKAGALGLPSCTTAGRPTSWTSGQARVVYDTDLGQLVLRFESGAWAPIGGGLSGTFPVPSTAPFSFSGTDGKAEGHDTGASGQYGFVGTSDREVYLGANDATAGDANVYMGNAGVTIQSDAPGTSSDYNMYSEIAVAKDGITLRATQGSGTGSGGTVTVSGKWFVIPVSGHALLSASGKQGAMIFDSGLNKPLWSDGTNWRDATGTAV